MEFLWCYPCCSSWFKKMIMQKRTFPPVINAHFYNTRAPETKERYYFLQSILSSPSSQQFHRWNTFLLNNHFQELVEVLNLLKLFLWPGLFVKTNLRVARFTQNHQHQLNLPKITFKMTIIGRSCVVCVQSTRLSKEPYFRSPIKYF